MLVKSLPEVSAGNNPNYQRGCFGDGDNEGSQFAATQIGGDGDNEGSQSTATEIGGDSDTSPRTTTGISREMS